MNLFYGENESLIYLLVTRFFISVIRFYYYPVVLFIGVYVRAGNKYFRFSPYSSLFHYLIYIYMKVVVY